MVDKDMLRILSAMVFIFFWTQGCGTLTLKMSPISELKGGSPLQEIDSMVFVVEGFLDEAGVVVAADFVRIDPRIPQIRIDRTGNDLLRGAVVSELVRNGHQVSPSSGGNSDAIIEGMLTKLALQNRPRILSLDLYAYAEATISAKCSEKRLTKVYSGISDCRNPTLNPHIVGAEEWEACLNDALSEVVKNFLMDADFLQLLKNIRNN